MRSKEALLESTDPRWIRIAGMIRRMAISLTTKVLWQLVGFRLPDGSQEVLNAEAFTGIGFFSRPPRSGEPEAIVVSVGDANAPMIIAMRDEKTRAKIVGALKVGETAMYNALSLFHIKDDGSMEARSATGAAGELATKADVTALANFVQGLFVGGQGSIKVPDGTVPQPTGTQKFKAE
jgi:phage gp45-like